jgi:hypothetical protein
VEQSVKRHSDDDYENERICAIGPEDNGD